MSTRAMTTASLAQFVVPLLFAVAVTACGSGTGRCADITGGMQAVVLADQITEGACRDLCQEQLILPDDCLWTEVIYEGRIVGPE